MKERDKLARALFDAARREEPVDEVRARALESARRARSAGAVDSYDGSLEQLEGGARALPPGRSSVPRSSKYAVLALAAAVVLFVLVKMHRRDTSSLAIGPEQVTSRRAPAPAKPEPGPLPPATEEPSPVPETRTTPRPASRPSTSTAALPALPVARPAASLPEEISVLDRARAALSKGDTASALSTLDEYERVLRGTRLTEEATLLRAEALARSGQTDAAARIARKFIEDYPGSALSGRARSFTGTGVSRVVKGDAGGTQ